MAIIPSVQAFVKATGMHKERRGVKEADGEGFRQYRNMQ